MSYCLINPTNVIYLTYLLDENPSFMKLGLFLNNSTVLMLGEDPSRALALEGQFEILYTNKGYEDAVGDYLISAAAAVDNPDKKLDLKLKDTAACICYWSKIDETYSMNTCRKRLIIEHVKEVTYSVFDTAIIESTSCSRETKKIISADELTIILTYFDFVFLVKTFQQHLNHMSVDYFGKVENYYKKNVTELQGQPTETRIYNFAKGRILKIGEVFNELNNSLAFFSEEMNKIEKMRQALMMQNDLSVLPSENIQNEKKLSNKFNKTRITSDQNSLVLSITPKLKLLIINYFRNVFCPILYVDIKSPAFQSKDTRYGKKNDQFTCELEVNYYNIEASAWEPLLEPFSIDYKGLTTIDTDAKTVSLYNNVNLNISETLINLLKNSLEIWNTVEDIQKPTERSIILKEKHVQKLEEAQAKTNYETISEYGIENKSGEIIAVTFKDLPRPQREIIGPDEMVSLCRDPSDAIKGCIFIGRAAFRIRVDFDSKPPIRPIDNLNISMVTQFYHDHLKGDTKNYFICVVKVVSMRKIFSITTSTQLINQLEMPIKLTFRSSSNTQYESNLGACSGDKYISRNMLNEKAFLTATGAKTPGKSTFSFTQLADLFKTGKAVQINVGDNLLAVLTLQLSIENKLNQYILFAPFCIYNCLPLSITGKFLASSKQFSVEPMNTVCICTQSVSGSVPIELNIHPFKAIHFTFEEKINVDFLQ